MKKVIIGVSVVVAIVVAILFSYGHDMARNAEYYKDRCNESDRQVARLEEALRRAKHEYHVELVQEMVKTATANERLLVSKDKIKEQENRLEWLEACEKDATAARAAASKLNEGKQGLPLPKFPGIVGPNGRLIQ